MNSNINFDSISISGTSIKVMIPSETFLKLSKKLDDAHKSYDYDEITEILNLHDMQESLFLDEFFILQTKEDFDLFLDKFQNKTMNKEYIYQLYNYKKELFENVNLLKSIDILEFTKVLQANNISLENIEKEQVYIPPVFFYLWKEKVMEFFPDKNNSFLEELTVALKYLEELFSLIYIADKTTFKDNTFKFIISGSDDKKVSKKVEWGKWDELQSTNYYNIYRWENKRKNINKSISLNIVRNYFLNKGNIELDINSEETLNTLLNIVIKGDIEIYYEQKNKLKEEVFSIEKMISESKRDILKNLLALIISIGIGFYGIIFDKENFSFLTKNIPLMWMFRFMIVAVAYFGFTYFLNIYEVRKFYDNTQRIYTHHLLFDKDDFDSMIKKPDYISKDNLLYLFILCFFLILLLFLENNYRKGDQGFLNMIIQFFRFLKIMLNTTHFFHKF